MSIQPVGKFQIFSLTFHVLGNFIELVQIGVRDLDDLGRCGLPAISRATDLMKRCYKSQFIDSRARIAQAKQAYLVDGNLDGLMKRGSGFSSKFGDAP